MCVYACVHARIGQRRPRAVAVLGGRSSTIAIKDCSVVVRARHCNNSMLSLAFERQTHTTYRGGHTLKLARIHKRATRVAIIITTSACVCALAQPRTHAQSRSQKAFGLELSLHLSDTKLRSCVSAIGATLCQMATGSRRLLLTRNIFEI